MQREQVSKEAIQAAISRLTEKLSARLQQHGEGTFSSRHEIQGIITEEYDELIDAVRAEPIARVADELIDIAVGAVFGVACIEDQKVQW